MSNYNSTLQSNNTDLQAILNTINELPNAGGEQATPVISVNSANGLITATAGAKSSTHQLAFQAAKTITPATVTQTAVSSGYYTGGAVTVKGDSNLIAGNIKSGVSIFGVSGNYVGSGGGDTSAEDAIVSGNISSYTNSRVTAIGSYKFANCTNLLSVNFQNVKTINDSAFYYCYKLASVSFPNAIYIGDHAFYMCSSLTTVNFPEVTFIMISAFQHCEKLTTVSFPKTTMINNNAFYACRSLTTVSFPAATSIGSYAFSLCNNLTTASFPAATSIGSSVFFMCYNLKSLYLTGSSLCKLSNSNAFYSTPIGGYSASAKTYGSIYVPASLLASYKSATNWTYFSSRFVGI